MMKDNCAGRRGKEESLQPRHCVPCCNKISARCFIYHTPLVDLCKQQKQLKKNNTKKYYMTTRICAPSYLECSYDDALTRRNNSPIRATLPIENPTLSLLLVCAQALHWKQDVTSVWLSLDAVSLQTVLVRLLAFSHLLSSDEVSSLRLFYSLLWTMSSACLFVHRLRVSLSPLFARTVLIFDIHSRRFLEYQYEVQ